MCRQAKHGVCRRDAQVAQRRQFEAAAERRAINGADQRHRQARQRIEARMSMSDPVTPEVHCVEFAPVGDVGAGAECPHAGSRQDNGPQAAIFLDAPRTSTAS